MNSQSNDTESSKGTPSASRNVTSRQEQFAFAQRQQDWALMNKALYPQLARLPTPTENKTPLNNTLMAQATIYKKSEVYNSGLSEQDKINANPLGPPILRGTQGKNPSPFDKGVDAWVKDYVSQRFPVAMRENATIFLTNVLSRYGDKPEQPFIRAELKDMLSSYRRSPENALVTLETLRMEMSGAKPRVLSYSGMTPQATIETGALQKMGRESFSDVIDLISAIKGMSPKNTETSEQAKERVRAEGYVRKFAHSLGQTNVTNIIIKPRDANNIIALTEQDSSAVLMKSPHSFAADISWESKYLNAPIKSNITVWFNPSIFVRIGTPYADLKGRKIDPDTKIVKPPTVQAVGRVGGGEVGIQFNVGPNFIKNQSNYLNIGGSAIARGPSGKIVWDLNPFGRNNLSNPKKTFTASPTVGMYADASWFATVFTNRIGQYVEFNIAKPNVLLIDKLNIYFNPEFLKDIKDGKFALDRRPPRTAAQINAEQRLLDKAAWNSPTTFPNGAPNIGVMYKPKESVGTPGGQLQFDRFVLTGEGRGIAYAHGPNGSIYKTPEIPATRAAVQDAYGRMYKNNQVSDLYNKPGQIVTAPKPKAEPASKFSNTYKMGDSVGLPNGQLKIRSIEYTGQGLIVVSAYGPNGTIYTTPEVPATRDAVRAAFLSKYKFNGINDVYPNTPDSIPGKRVADAGLELNEQNPGATVAQVSSLTTPVITAENRTLYVKMVGSTPVVKNENGEELMRLREGTTFDQAEQLLTSAAIPTFLKGQGTLMSDMPMPTQIAKAASDPTIEQPSMTM